MLLNNGSIDSSALEELSSELDKLGTELRDPLQVEVRGTNEAIEASVFFRDEEMQLDSLALSELAHEIPARIRFLADELTAYRDVMEFFACVHRVSPHGEQRLESQRFTFALSRREALMRLGLGHWPFLFFRDSETKRNATLFRLSSGAAYLFIEDPLLFEQAENNPTSLQLSCLELSETGDVLRGREFDLPLRPFESLAKLVLDVQSDGLFACRHPQTGLLVVVAPDGDGAIMFEYSFDDKVVEHEAMEGFAPARFFPEPRDWRQVLACPGCSADLTWVESGPLECADCHRKFERATTGAPCLMLPEDTPEELAIEDEWIPNPSPKILHYFVCRYRGGLVLDSGAGLDPHQFPNLINLEVFAFAKTTVVANGERLPFRTGSIDAVLSMAVLEHVPDPPAYCRELARVLVPGGETKLDSAFLQPYHACPDHYYGTTLSGLRLASGDLEEVAAGVGPGQAPFVALQTFLGAYASFLSEEHRDRFYSMTLSELMGLPPGPGVSFVRIPPEHEHRVASGVYFHGRKSHSKPR